MSEAVIAAVITGVVTLAVCMVNNAYQQRKADQRQDETIRLIEYKIDQLTERVNKHNNVVERTYQLEQHSAIVDEQIKVANHRLADLERAG